MDIISRKYINEGFNSKAYIINDDYILLDGVNQNSYKNYQKYVNVINQISNVKSLEIPRIIELIEPCEEYPNGALIYKMIKGHTFRKEHIEIVNLDNIAKKLAEFMDELYEIRVDFDKDEYIKNELEITEQSVIELKAINEQISNFAQTYPTNLKASSNEALLFMRRYRFANCSCFSCCFKDSYPSSNVQ